MGLSELSKLESLHSSRLDIIILHSQKGGPGKTTLSCNIAHELAKRGNKTVLVDLDIAQPTIQHIFHVPDDEIKITINDILLGESKVEEEALIKTKYPNLFLITAT
ncbi:MAG: AAA family ATPase, partial [Candidatus Heimdallarchaeota archaeon]|nr:AAA family ATPase [Candidatus Heimdallarchaeota archaeon]MCK4877999.1 AAA family ATPase [Candidatus Heimdallarchaeota archaeon]